MDNGASSYRRFRQDGDEQGLAEIICKYRDGLIFYLNSFVNNLSVAEELAEETFVILGVKKPKDKNRGSFKTWLYTIGRNTALNYIKKNKRIVSVSISEIEELSDPYQNLEESFIKEEKKLKLHRAIKKLKPEYSQVLYLTYFEDFSNKETARLLNKSVHNAETLVYRARIALKKQLEKEDFEYEEL